MPVAISRAIGGAVCRPLRFCARSLLNISGSVGKTLAQMLHVKGPVRGLGWVHRGMRSTQSRAPAAAANASHVHELAPDVEALIRGIHGNKTKAVVYVTGGAVQSISWLLAVPGASATVLEASVPYARDSLVSVLGQEPEQYCSAATAAAMAEAAYRRAADLSAFGSSVVGLGATCSLATVDVKRGDHRAFVAVYGGSGGRCLELTLAKGARTRVGEDDLVSRLLIKLLAEASGCDSSVLQLSFIAPPSPPTPAGTAMATAAPSAAPSASASSSAGTNGQAVAPPLPAAVQAYDVLSDTRQPAGDPVERLLAAGVRCVEFCGSEVVVDAPRHGRVYLPGSFNPLHEGHRKLLAEAVKAAAAVSPGGLVEGAFELTVENADKGLLAADDIRRRVAQFVELGLPVVVTRAPLFTNKADLLSRSRFVVGYDTVARLVLPKYYGNSYMQMVLDFARLRQQGCSFIVAGRKDPETGRFMSLGDVEMPPELADLFPIALPEEDFRLDISSTELRRKAQAQAQ